MSACAIPGRQRGFSRTLLSDGPLLDASGNAGTSLLRKQRGIVFLFSLTFRSLDWDTCELAGVDGHAIGTHFLWHILNSVTLYLLLMGAIRFGRRKS